ncbi:MAG: hypothetical protein RIT26_1586 [Pseudomonadota bacterium]
MGNLTTDSLSGKKVLVLDQDAARLQQLKQILEEQSMVFHQAGNLQSLVEKAVFFKPNLCVFSLNTKDADPQSVSDMLAANPSTARIPIIYQADIHSLLSAYTNQIGGKAQRFEFITWPYNRHEILLRLSLIVNGSRVEDTPESDENFSCEINAQSSRFDKIIFNGVHKIIRRHLSDTPPMTQMAKMVGTNTKRLSETFRRVCNMTVYQYIIEVKMGVAEQMLRETNLDISDISADLGYSTQANFSTAFKHKFGVSPRVFRKSPLPSPASAPASRAAAPGKRVERVAGMGSVA